MKSLRFLFLCLIPISVLSQNQVVHLPLTFHDGNGPFEYALPAIKWNDTLIAVKNTYPEFKNVPSNLKDIKRGRIIFDFAQYFYQGFIAGKISTENFTIIKNKSGIKFNEATLIKQEIKCYVNLISGKNENNEVECSVDANNNYDFGDDRSFKPMNANSPDEELNKHLINVLAQRVLNGKIINDKTPLLIAENESLLTFSIAQHATTALHDADKSYELAVCPLWFVSATWKQTQLVLLSDSLKTKKANKDLIFNVGDIITIGNSTYKYNGVDISKNILSLQKISSANQYSSQVGFRAPLFTSENLLTGKQITLDSLKGKYVLIDFWGTWCKPCRAQLPDLVKLNNSADSSRFILMSIASSDKLDSLKAVIKKENMVWPQMLSDKVTEQYHVNAFPKSFLINPDGVIIGKDLSIDELKEKLTKLSILSYE